MFTLCLNNYPTQEAEGEITLNHGPCSCNRQELNCTLGGGIQIPTIRPQGVF